MIFGRFGPCCLARPIFQVTAQDTVGFDTVPLVELRSVLVGPEGCSEARSHGTMEWIPGQTLHFDVPKEATEEKEMRDF